MQNTSRTGKEAVTPGESRKQRIIAALTRNLSLRLHVSLIIAFSWCCGFLVTWQLHRLGVDSLVVRYGLALIVGYAAFLLGVRVWFWCVFNTQHPRSNLVGDTADAISDVPSLNFGGGGGGSSTSAIEIPTGGGGSSGGGGASASWGGSSSGSSGGGGGFDLDIGDGDGIAAIVVGICLLAVALTVVATMVYVVSIGPHLLGEAAFQFLLAGGLLKRARNTDASWIGSVIRQTWLPFTIVFVFMMIFAGAATLFFPHAHTIGEVVLAITNALAD